MNIELDEVAVQETSDEALELAAGAAQGLDNMPKKYLTLLWNLC